MPMSPIIPTTHTMVISESTEPYNPDRLEPPFIAVLNATTGRPEKFGSFLGTPGTAGQVAIEVPVNGSFVLQTGQRSKTGRMAWQSFSAVVEGVPEDENSPVSAKKKLLEMCHAHNQKYQTEESKK